MSKVPLFPLRILTVFLAFSFAKNLSAEETATKSLGRTRAEGAPTILSLPREETSGNTALFVGIGHFADESGLSNLRYTVNDAVALAYVFVQETRLVPPQRTWLAISGQPTNEVLEGQLKELLAAGVNLIVPDKIPLLKALQNVMSLPTRAEDMVILSFSSHGFEEKGEAFIMPKDGLANFVVSSGLSLDSVRSLMKETAARKRLLLVDACREVPVGETRGSARMNAALAEALRQARGTAIVMSCREGQLSTESSELEHGIFTHYFLEGLRGAANANEETGLIYLYDVAKYTQEQTRRWVKQNRGAEQDPWFEGDPASLPLAVAAEIREIIREREERQRTALSFLVNASAKDATTLPWNWHGEIRQALTRARGEQREYLLSELERLKDLQDFALRAFARFWTAERASFLDTPSGTDAPSPPPDQTAPTAIPNNAQTLAMQGTQANTTANLSPPADPSTMQTRRIDFTPSANGKRKLYILPNSFSAGARKNFPAFVDQMQTKGYGYALWSEMEEVLQGNPDFEIVMVETGQEDFFSQLQDAFGTELTRNFPDSIISIDTNVFDDGSSEKLSGFSAEKIRNYHFTIYLNYIFVDKGRLRKVSSQADARGENPILAARQAIGAATQTLLQRVSH